MTRLEQILTERRMSKGLDNAGNQLTGLYDLILKSVKPGMKIITVGCYEGSSDELFYLSMNPPNLYCIDPWADNVYFGQETLEDLDRAEKVFDERMKNYIGKGCTKLKMKSSEAYKLFENNSIDLVYLDGAHTTKDVIEDLNNYLPKIKENGFICGHDYNETVKEAVNIRLGIPELVFSDSSWIFSKRSIDICHQ